MSEASQNSSSNVSTRRDQKVINGLRFLYISALFSVAFLLAAVSWIFIQSIEDQGYASRVVNISGRQRMLSQRMSKWMILLKDAAPDEPQRAYWVAKLKKDQIDWTRGHYALQFGDAVLRLPRLVEDSTLSVSFIALQPRFESLNRLVDQTIAASAPSSADTARTDQAAPEPGFPEQSELLAMETAFVELMDQITFRFDEVYRAQISDLRRLHFRVLLASFFVLLIEALFIFRPIVRILDRRLRTLERTRLELRASNEKTRVLGEQQLESQRLHLGDIVLAEEGERLRIARDLHDSLGQMLLAVRMYLSTALQNPNQAPKELLNRAISELDRSSEELRHILNNLSPPSLERFGLVEAISGELEKFRHSESEFELVFRHTLNSARFEKKIEYLLFRIFQELLGNAIKHSAASSIEIQLLEHPEHLTLMVEDNGIGFDPFSPGLLERGSGMLHLRSRIELLKGSMNLDSKPGQGTTAIAQIPLS